MQKDNQKQIKTLVLCQVARKTKAGKEAGDVGESGAVAYCVASESFSTEADSDWGKGSKKASE